MSEDGAGARGRDPGALNTSMGILAKPSRASNGNQHPEPLMGNVLGNGGGRDGKETEGETGNGRSHQAKSSSTGNGISGSSSAAAPPVFNTRLDQIKEIFQMEFPAAYVYDRMRYAESTYIPETDHLAPLPIQIITLFKDDGEEDKLFQVEGCLGMGGSGYVVRAKEVRRIGPEEDREAYEQVAGVSKVIKVGRLDFLREKFRSHFVP